jgi:ketosteroid isomerase-like protein
MRNVFAAITAFLLLLAAGCAPKVNDPADVAAIKKSMGDFEKAVNAGNADAVAALMTDKTIWADSNVPVQIGAKAIRSQWQPFFDQYRLEFSGPVEDVRVEGGVAVARGPWTMKAAPKVQDEAAFSDSGSWMVVFARQSDASWKWDWLVANSDQPLPGSTASGEDEKALLQTERKWADAAMKKDAAALDRILATEFIGHDAESTRNKKQALAQLKSNSVKIESGQLSDMRALVFGDRAVVHGMWTEKSTTGGKDTSGKYRWMDIFVKRDGRWQCVGSYSQKAG